MSSVKSKISLILLLFISVFSTAVTRVQAQIATAAAGLSPANELTGDTLNKLNPLLQFSDPTTAKELSTPGGIITRVLVYAFPIAGLILFVMIVWGGFEILSGATDKKSLDTGKNRITAALVGFILLFASYWIVQVIQVIFGVRILG